MITSSPVWVPTRFNHKGVQDAQRKLLTTLENTYNFFALYANLDGYRPTESGTAAYDLLDRWIISRLNSVIIQVRSDMEGLNFTRAAKLLGEFFIDDVSNWYVRLSRRRFWKGEMTGDKRAAFATLYAVLEGSLRLLAPFIPFTTEEIYRGLRAHLDPADSVHLADYPQADPGRRLPELEGTMTVAQEVVGLGRSLRQTAGVRTRQPLSRLLLHSDNDRAGQLIADERLRQLVADEMNVKTIELLDNPRQVARLTAKPNYRALGPRFGSQAPAAAAAIGEMSPDQIMTLRAQGSVTLAVEGQPTEFGPTEIEVAETGLGPYVAAAGNGLTVALETTLSEELVLEGLCREIVNRIQNLRKKSGLAVSDRIELSVSGSQPIGEVIARYRERIAQETLARSVDSGLDLPYQDRSRIDDIEIVIALRKCEPGRGGNR
jgi:isoleucyl-tRNA synthetase